MSTNTSHSQVPKEYAIVPVILVDGIIHNEHGFCYDMTHECHESSESIADFQTALQEGEVTVAEADLIYQAKTV